MYSADRVIEPEAHLIEPKKDSHLQAHMQVEKTPKHLLAHMKFDMNKNSEPQPNQLVSDIKKDDGQLSQQKVSSKMIAPQSDKKNVGKQQKALGQINPGPLSDHWKLVKEKEKINKENVDEKLVKQKEKED